MTDAVTVRETLEASAGPVLYSDLVAHLKRNGVFFVGPEASLLDAAVAIATDDAASVTRLIESSALRRPTEEEARTWAASPGRTWTAIVVQPFVLIADPAD